MESSGNCENCEELLEIGMGLMLVIMGYYLHTGQRERRWWVRPSNTERKEKGAFDNLYKHMKTRDPEMYFKYMRMSPECCDKLLLILRRRLSKRSRRESLSPEFRLAMTVKFLAHGGSLQSLAWEFRVGHSTASKVIKETCEVIWDCLRPLYMILPASEEEWIAKAHGFDNKWNFPHTLGAIDGKHVQIQCPSSSGSLYHNYKSFFSLVLLACCDAKYKFIWVDIGAAGSENDSSVFRRSKIGQKLESGTLNIPPPSALGGFIMSYSFVADEAFPLKHYIMRPFPGKNLEVKKKVFNYRLSRARRTIENAFGILASPWRVYRQPLTCSVETTNAIVKATVCLHNFLCQEAQGTYYPPGFTDSEDNGIVADGEWRAIVENDKNILRVRRLGSNFAPTEVYKFRNLMTEYVLENDLGATWRLNHVTRGSF